jgi:hypothetical protein
MARLKDGNTKHMGVRVSPELYGLLRKRAYENDRSIGVEVRRILRKELIGHEAQDHATG